MKPLVIIHGWSDDSSSFVNLAQKISDKTDRDIESIFLGNYVSLDDDVQMSDIVSALGKAWKNKKLPTKAKGTDVIVHSTGGLVIRDWIATQWVAKGKKPPINNLVLLAPANFGSPLAHKGRAFYGRVVKGFNSDKKFETGTHILKALEMASPYSWDLAQTDRFRKNCFSASQIRATTIIGNTGYSGISSIANANGSDGTVYCAAANLNCHSLKIEFPRNSNEVKIKSQKSSIGETAFLVLDDHNHSSITLNEEGPDTALKNILKALSISSSAEYKAWVKSCQNKTRAVMKENAGKKYKQGYQNTVFRVRDDQGNDVKDYVVEFYHNTDSATDRIAKMFNRDAVSKVHAYKDNGAYRSFMINCTRLMKLINKPNESLRISISALPDVNDENTLAGYCTFDCNDIGYVELKPADLKKFFVPNRTMLVDIVLKRIQKQKIFSIDSVA